MSISPPIDVLSPTPVQRFVDSNGNALVGGLLFTYAAGTTTPLATYTDATGTTPNANPIVLNARGEAPIWLGPGTSYKFVLSPPWDSNPPTSPIWTVDNISAGASSGGGGGGGGSAVLATTVSASFTITPGITVYRVNTAAGAVVVTPPPSPVDAVSYLIQDAYGAAGTAGHTIIFNGTLNGAVNPTLVQVAYGWHWIMWNATTNQWGYSG